MREKAFVLVCILIALIPSAFSSGSIQTGSISPVSMHMCGDYPQFATVSAGSLLNTENLTLTGVVARLIIQGTPGITFVTPQDVSLGNINPLATISSGPSWTIQCNSPVQGVYLAYINYTTSNGYKASSSDEANTVLTVHDLSSFYANITLIQENSAQQEQESYPVIGDDTPTLKVATNRNALCKGSLDNDEPYQDMDFIFYGTMKDHNYTVPSPLSEGMHRAYVRCKDDLDNVMQSSFLITFLIDTTAPGIVILSPGQKVLGEFSELKVSSFEDASCRYSKQDLEYSEMKDFAMKANNTFSTPLIELEEKDYDYYIKCVDKVNNLAKAKINFGVEIPPKAQISLEKDPPLSKGTYEVRLTPSKKLRAVPVLSYSFTDDPAFTRQVSLIKEGSYYKGYIIIDGMDKTRSGVFSFRGYDLNGNEGTEITQGSIFLVDTVKPFSPQSLQAIATEEGISLKWYYDGEKEKEFIVYRSASPGAAYIHNYDSSLAQEYTDKNVITNQLYYYGSSPILGKSF